MPENCPARVLIVGSGGAGKTVLATRMSAELGIAVTHLDEVLHRPDWSRTSAEDFIERQRAAVAAAEWIIEGTYPRTLPIRLAAADTVIFLDLPTAVCLWGVVKRRLRYGRGQHPGGVFGTASLSFLRHVALFRRTIRPGLLTIIDRNGGHARVIRLRSRRQVKAYLTNLSAPAHR